MRHMKSGRKLNRTSSHREAMFKNMAASVIKHELIKTTLPKAKELRRVVEPLITLAKKDSEANRRVAFSRLRDSEVVTKLFEDLGPRFKARPGGYTRILHLAPRPGDSAPMSLMQLVDGPAAAKVEAPADEGGAKKKTAKKKAKSAPAAEAAAPKKKKKAAAA